MTEWLEAKCQNNAEQSTYEWVQIALFFPKALSRAHAEQQAGRERTQSRRRESTCRARSTREHAEQEAREHTQSKKLARA